ncbi:DsrH/TusB family sulfur metabolism protein [Marinomonas ostreistagni]|uniref:DsrH/TusB family sulfur metabolism protein n=1 Tax=Marinomonas ostreistagni TaxID=359209 RepID=UPI0019507B15|nr:DsrH/TusB family sulfur metabolism protein [Marinomonas ostreistagni]MBM6549590.1 hypothetical protein [Marinomonas ostreistagni]
MKLYQINQSLYPVTVEQDWLNTLQQGDAVLFMESGVLKVQQCRAQIELLDERGVLIFYRQSDLDSYAVKPLIGHGISDQEWVELTTRSHPIVSW